MFRQLYWKLTGLVIVAVFVAVIITGSLGIFNVIESYEADFSASVEEVAKSDLADSVLYLMNSETADEIRLPQLEAVLNTYAGKLGLDENRAGYILSARDAGVIVPSSLSSSQMTITDNLLNAMRGGKGDKVSAYSEFLDMACFIKNGNQVTDGYILYVRDNKTELNILIQRTVSQVLWAMLIGFIISVLIGFATARIMSKPLRLISKRVEQFTKGNFAPSLDKVPDGEMGDLVRSFNSIGMVMNRNLKQISAEKHKIEVMLEHIDNGIIAFDTRQKVVHINTAAAKMFDISNPDELIFDNFFDKLETGLCMAQFMYLDTSKSQKRDLLVGEKHINGYFAPFKMDNERIAGVVCLFEDVTEQFNLEAARQKFVAEVSHELKTPLTTIRTYTETLLNGYLDDKKMTTSLLTTVQNETDKMTAMVNNLLLLNRFDMQISDISKEFFSLDDMLRRLENMFRLEAEKKGLSISYNRTTELIDVYADQDKIERAVKNIISNSIKYCSKGDKIQIFAGQLYNNIYIKVEDSGKGIPKSDLEHVFERFYRVDKDRSRERGGTGLGLAITKEIIEGHNGTIQIESEFGRFTRVTINLPVTVQE